MRAESTEAIPSAGARTGSRVLRNSGCLVMGPSGRLCQVLRAGGASSASSPRSSRPADSSRRCPSSAYEYALLGPGGVPCSSSTLPPLSQALRCSTPTAPASATPPKNVLVRSACEVLHTSLGYPGNRLPTSLVSTCIVGPFSALPIFLDLAAAFILPQAARPAGGGIGPRGGRVQGGAVGEGDEGQTAGRPHAPM